MPWLAQLALQLQPSDLPAAVGPSWQLFVPSDACHVPISFMCVTQHGQWALLFPSCCCCACPCLSACLHVCACCMRLLSCVGWSHMLVNGKCRRLHVGRRWWLNRDPEQWLAPRACCGWCMSLLSAGVCGTIPCEKLLSLTASECHSQLARVLNGACP